MAWYENPELTPHEDAVLVLRDPEQRRLFPRQFVALQTIIESKLQQVEDQARRDNPFAFAELSYEQTLKCNAWWAGITFIINFSANRIGKTASNIFNALLYILGFPPTTDFRPFQPRIDHLGRRCELLRRPSIERILEIVQIVRDPTFHKQYGTPNPQLPHFDPQNIQLFDLLGNKHLLDPQPPFLPSVVPPAYQDNPNVIWHGAPDREAHEETTFPEWQKWLPKQVVKNISTYEGTIDLEFPRNDPSQPPIRWRINTKSYDSKDTKWSGAAVDGIILSEGPTQAIFNEVKQRFKVTGFAGWDYTPYEPRNQGPKSNLAHRVAKGEEPTPLRAHVFTNESALDAPNFILPQTKKDDLYRNWHNKPEGQARLYGKFFTSIPLALSHLSERIHCLRIDLAELRRIRPNLILYRSIDPGWGHVTACVWAALSSQNEWFIYRGYSETQKTISERVDDIIALSHNKKAISPRRYKLPDHEIEVPIFVEQQTTEQYKASYIDWHTFKADELTGTPFAMNYVRAGIPVTQSIHLGPRERAQIFNDKAKPQPSFPHPLDPSLPGARVYFLVGTEENPNHGVALIWDKLTNLFYKTLEGGPRKGQTTDKLQDIDDDEFDAASYLVASPIRYIAPSRPNDRVLSNKREMMGVSQV